MNPVAFSIGNFDIRWYSILILIGVIIGLLIANREAKRFNISKDFMFNMCFWALIAAFIGARLYYVIFNFSEYKDNLIDILKVWEGGLAIHGGLIGGYLAIIIYSYIYKVRPHKFTDIIVPSLILGQALGRWGNFFNGEAHGMATTLNTLQNLHIPEFIIKGMQIEGIYYHPTFLYESLWCILGFIILLIIKRYRYLKVGQLTCIYLMWYGVGRFFIESMRTDFLKLSTSFGTFRIAQVVSVALFLIGLIFFIIQSRKGKFEDLYNEIGSEGSIKF